MSKSLKDLTIAGAGILGFEAPSTRGNIAINIRGVGSGNPNNLTIDTANAIYIDGVYMGRAAGTGVDTGDIAQIEVLRGPQGTLYGRNSTGGALNIITRKPAEEFGADIKVSAGTEGLFGYRLRVDSGLIGGGLRASFTARARKRDDLYANLNPDSNKDFENINREGYRLSAAWDNGEVFSANYIFDLSEIKNERTQALTVEGLNPLGAGVLAADGYPTSVTNRSGDRLGAVMQTLAGLERFPVAVRTGAQTQVIQWANDWLKWYENTITNPSSSKVGAADTRHTSGNKVDGHSLTLSWKNEDANFEIKSITGLRNVKNVNMTDLDGQDNTLRPLAEGSSVTTGVIADTTLLTLGALLFDTISPLVPAQGEAAAAAALIAAMNARGRAETFNTFITHDYEQITQEIQLVGSSSKLDYALGVYLFDDEGTRGGQSTSLFPIAFTFSNAYRSSSDAKAVYGQMSLLPVEGLSLTAGIRYTTERKNITYLYRSSEVVGGFVGLAVNPTTSVTDAYAADDAVEDNPTVDAAYDKHYSRKFNNLSGRLAASYQFTDNFNVYASYSSGYRSGYFNGESFLIADSRPDSVNEETIDSFEIGFKSEWLDQKLRLNAAFFNYKYKDVQVSTLGVAENGSIISRTANSGDAERSGIELEFAARINENLDVSFNLASFSGDFDTFPELVAVDPMMVAGADGDGRIALPVVRQAQNPLTPNLQLGWSVDWDIARFNSSNLRLNVNGTHQGTTVPIAINTAIYDTNRNRVNDTPIVFEQIKNQARSIINMRLSLNDIRAGSGRFDVALWATNLLDKKYRHFSFNYGAALGLNVSQAGNPRLIGVDFSYSF